MGRVWPVTSAPAPSALLRPLLLGVATGARSQLGPAALAWSPPRREDPRPLRLLRTRPCRVAVTLAAAGELVGDKLPRTPSRLSRPVLTARLVAGAVVGALAADPRDPVTTALSAAAGMVGAGAASWAGATARQTLPARTGTSDLPWALAEDATAVALAAAVTRLR